MVGDSVTLHTYITAVQRGDVIEWRFGTQETLLVKMNKDSNGMTLYNDALNGRFRDGLQVDDQTGCLTVTNSGTEHSGLYELKISNRRRSIQRRFIVTVGGE